MADIQVHRTNVEGQVASDDAVAGNPLVVGARADTTAPTDVGDGDAVYLWADPSGALVVSGHDGTNPQPISVNTSGELTVTSNVGTGNRNVIGNVAHDGPDSAAPIKIGLKAVSSLESQTMVAANDRSDAYGDLDGVLVMKLNTTGADILNERVTNTNGTSTAFATFGAGGAGVRNFVTTIITNNTANTDGFLDIRDGTAGSVLMTVPLPKNTGAVVTLPVPLRQPTANTALAFDVNAAITTIYISLVGYQGKT